MKNRVFLAAPAALLIAGGLAGCENKVPELVSEPRPAVSAEPEQPEPAETIKEDLSVGTGAEANTGDKVKVNYTGRLKKTNFMFDTSVGPGKKPFEFTIGKGQVIKGWDEGVVGMKVGGKRKLTIPSRLAYGEKGSPPKIPGKSTLVFEIELLSVGDAADAGAKDGGSGDAGTKDKGKDKKDKK
jgi:FKBP-type peptidyl-prolyl cis-trans isomerase FkpA